MIIRDTDENETEEQGWKLSRGMKGEPSFQFQPSEKITYELLESEVSDGSSCDCQIKDLIDRLDDDEFYEAKF